MADKGATSSGENPVGYQLDANRDVDLQKPDARVGHGVQSEPNEAAAGQAVALSKISLVRRICGRRQVPAVCQVHDTVRFP